MSDIPSSPSDEMAVRALTRPPDAALTRRTLDRIVADIADRPQRRVGLGLIGLRGVTPRQPLAGLVLLVIGLILAATLAVIAGSRRPGPFPSGGEANGFVAIDVDGDIRLVRVDPPEMRQLTATPYDKFAPAFSPDGDVVAFWELLSTQGDTTTAHDLVVIDFNGGPERRVARVSGQAARRISWSPDGRRLAYADVEAGRRTVFTVGLDGARPVPHGPPGIDGWDPVWSPDGTRIGFLGGRVEADRGFYVMGSDGSNPHRVSTAVSPGNGYAMPDWSAATDRVVVAVEAGGADRFQRDIWVLASDGSRQIDISNDPADELAPLWSRDGKRVAWLRVEPGRSRVVVADADGRNAEVLPPANVAGFAWSPDATKVLLKIYTNSNTGQIESYDLASGAVSPLGQGVIDGDGSWQHLSP